MNFDEINLQSSISQLLLCNLFFYSRTGKPNGSIAPYDTRTEHSRGRACHASMFRVGIRDMLTPLLYLLPNTKVISFPLNVGRRPIFILKFCEVLKSSFFLLFRPLETSTMGGFRSSVFFFLFGVDSSKNKKCTPAQDRMKNIWRKYYTTAL